MREVQGLAVVLFLLAGCGGNGGGPATSCDYSGRAGMCSEYTGFTDAVMSDVRSGCLQAGGAWQACPATVPAGTCDVTIPDGGHTRIRYYAGSICSEEEGRTLCDAYAFADHTARYTPGSVSCGAASDQTLRCDVPSRLHACYTISGPMTPERVDLFRRACASSGTLIETPCPPAAGALGVCTSIDRIGLTETAAYYADADPTSLESDCTDAGGTWTAPDASLRSAR